MPAKAFTSVLRALRPHQWLKNVLIALPVIAAHQTAAQALAQLAIAAAAFCLCASAGYVLNDILDRDHDRKHPRKRNRPFSSGMLSPGFGVALCAALLVGAFAASIALPRGFTIVLAGYFALTVAYSAFLKKFLMIDVVVLASLYGLRVVAGGAATGVPLSEWMIAFCVFFFVSLALVKRTAEIKGTANDSGAHLPGRGYRAEDLPVVLALASAAGFVSILILALYLDSENVRALYRYPFALWGVGLILIFWIGRVILLAARGEMHDDPVVFAVTDPNSIVSIVGAGIMVVLSS
jgi:4-hydroxybenzoate polyprenyltransferase